MAAAKKKEAKLKAQIEFRKKLQRDALERELASQAYHRGKLDKAWRAAALKFKEPEMRQEIEVMWHTFERAFDKKDAVIASIMKLMDIADNQFQRTFATYCDTVDNMIIKFMEDMDVISKENDEKTAVLLKSDDKYHAEVEKQLILGETHLNLAIYWRHVSADSLAWTSRGEFMVKEDEYKKVYLDIREDLRSFLEDEFNATWINFKGVLKSYVVGTAENQRKVRKLRVKVNQTDDIIAAQAKKIANNDKVLRRLCTELGSYESGSKQAVFRDRRNRHRDACQRLKTKLYSGINRDVKQLGLLVRISDEAVEALEAKKKKIEKILRLAAMCRKFETLREKVLPYGSARPDSPLQANASGHKPPSEDMMVVNEIMLNSGLTGLWQRISRAELTKRALFREKIMLEHKNAALMQIIQADEVSNASLSSFPSETYECICGDKNKPSLKEMYVGKTLEISKIY